MVKQVFLSHASADKELYVIPFARKLDEIGISYWLDEAEIRWGDKIGKKINEGLNQSSFVIVFLTESFIGRNWTETELSAALNRENDEGRVVVLPIVVGNPKEILTNYPLLRDKSYQVWNSGLDVLVNELKSLVFKSHKDEIKEQLFWNSSIIQGSQLSLVNGIAGVVQMPNSHPLTSFSGDSTVILGAADSEGMESILETTATWSIPLDTDSLRYIDSGFLVVACMRYFGGVHSKTYNSRVKISLNNKAIDGFGLRYQPPNHSDYFHRVQLSNFPEVYPISNCQTVYAWSILRDKLENTYEQLISITIENYVRWDIDYIGLVFNTRKPV